MNDNIESPAVWQVDGENRQSTGWRDSIITADQAPGEATRIQDGIQCSLKLQREVRALREELKKAQADALRYQGLHARVVAATRQLENDHAAETHRLRAEIGQFLVRHRVYKVLSEHYALAALRFSAKTLAEHRDRVLQHVLFHKRKGRPLSEIGAGEVISKLL
ncbi:hypothetical protein [Cupriavidus sp. CuC1]|uniref:hypothetical protein n=1 Tax=Cupriavidus sp. CuC1 TaxID=3373131 RepID=UPI0037D10EF6